MIEQRARPARGKGALYRAWDWIVRHEAAPEPYDAGLSGRVAFGITLLLALVYATVMALYMIGRTAIYATHAEELGIMDQVLWNNLHGHFMTQTICNPISDMNCLGAISRFAIHFEPILIPLSLLYVIWPSVNTLFIFQALVVASGVIPIWRLATVRLRNPWWGVAFAALFMAYPPMIGALSDDFHPETIAATFLLWAFYFLTVRNYRALVIALVLALLCKETMTLDVMAIGLFVALFHKRWRFGAGIVALGALMLILALLLMRLYSPLGHSPVTGRYTELLHAPVSTLLAMAHDPGRRSYLIKLFAPYGFLPLASPWVAAIALPSIALNALSANSAMFSGKYQYNTDIAAVLVVASIDAMVWIAPLVLRLFAAARARLRQVGLPAWLVGLAQPVIVLVIVAIPALAVGLGPQIARVNQRAGAGSFWPVVTAHDRLGDVIAAEIPAGASVSAQSTLAPHVSERAAIFQYPFGATTADYVFVDVVTGDCYPFATWQAYVHAVVNTANSGDFQIADARDGYLLLRREPGAGMITLPQGFFSFAQASSLSGVHHVDVRFTGGLRLVGYQITPAVVPASAPQLTVTTYWQISQALVAPQTIVVTVTPPSGGAPQTIDESLTQDLLPPIHWQPGQTIVVQTWPITLDPSVAGTYTIGVEVRSGAPDQRPPASQAMTATVNTPPGADGLPVVSPNEPGVWLARAPLR